METAVMPAGSLLTAEDTGLTSTMSAVLISLTVIGCVHEPTTGLGDSATVVERTLRSLAAARHFVMGTAVDLKALRTDARYRQKLAAEYNGLTAETAMKFGPMHPDPTRYDFTAADTLVSFAQANGMTVHGHTLVWDEALPAWITAGTFTRSQLLQVLKDHITTVVGRYRGRIATWDVVNEAVDGHAAPLRNTIWLRVIGPDYIDSAFVWARRADPAAKLYVNENRAEGLNPKADAVLSLMQGLRARGIPVDGVGFQAHFALAPPPPSATDLHANLARFGAAGFDVRVSEMDVRIPDSADSSALAQQATVYERMLDACLRVGPRCVGFTTWGFTDRYSWIPSFFPGFGRALPFDADYAPKAAYDRLSTRLRLRASILGPR